MKLKKETLTLPVNDKNKLLTESVEKLDEIAKSFPTSDQFVFLTKEDYKNILKQIQVAVGKHPEGTNVNIDNEIKKLPFSLFFKYNYENYGLYAVKEKKLLKKLRLNRSQFSQLNLKKSQELSKIDLQNLEIKIDTDYLCMFIINKIQTLDQRHQLELL